MGADKPIGRDLSGLAGLEGVRLLEPVVGGLVVGKEDGLLGGGGGGLWAERAAVMKSCDDRG